MYVEGGDGVYAVEKVYVLPSGGVAFIWARGVGGGEVVLVKMCVCCPQVRWRGTGGVLLRRCKCCPHRIKGDWSKSNGRQGRGNITMTVCAVSVNLSRHMLPHAAYSLVSCVRWADCWWSFILAFCS